MSDYYDPDGFPISITTFGKLREDGTWAREHIETKTDEGSVSTVWLGADHSWGHGETPVIFETMAFAEGPFDQTQERYCTRDEARAGHAAMVERLKAERLAWSELTADPAVRDCAGRLAEVLTAHYREHVGDDVYGLGDMFDALVRQMAT